MTCDKNFVFLFLHEEYWISSCTICPLRKFKRFHVTTNEPVWPAWLVVNHGFVFSNKFGSSFLIRTIRVGFRGYWISVIIISLIQLFSNPLHCPRECVNAMLYSYAVSKFLEEWIVLWCSFPHRLYSADMFLLHSTQNLRKRDHMHQINYLRFT